MNRVNAKSGTIIPQRYALCSLLGYDLLISESFVNLSFHRVSILSARLKYGIVLVCMA